MANRNVKLKNKSGDYLYPYTDNIPTATTSKAGIVQLDNTPVANSNNAITSGAVNTALATVDSSIATKLDTTGTAAKATADASGNTITMTYATKTELSTVQNSIPNDGNIVHLTGSETITGGKIFEQASLEMRGISNDSSYEPYILFHIPGVQYARLTMTSSGLTVKSGDGANYSHILCSTPAVSDSSNKAVTSSYVNNKFKKVSALPSNPDANTYYFIPE